MQRGGFCLGMAVTVLSALAAGCFENGGAPCGGLQGIPCVNGQFCDFVDGSCGAADALGICKPFPEACAEIFAPVCGCDGRTYGNECEAAVAGISVVSEGECENEINFCGGLLGAPCGDGEYCQFEPGTCGAADQSGVCTPIPEVCTLEFAPVCGCDDQTYSNECQAAAAGVSIVSEGECPE